MYKASKEDEVPSSAKEVQILEKERECCLILSWKIRPKLS
jgi:hypothetical protein